MVDVSELTAAFQEAGPEPLGAALRFAAAGIPVLPLHTPGIAGCSCGRATCSSPGKHPRTLRGVKDATADPAAIEAWWKRWPDANVGLAMGGASGLVVLDVDPRNGGEAGLAELAGAGIPLATLTVETGRGRHLYFGSPGMGIRSRKLGSGIDLQADGTYVVAPPSLHVSGRRYRLASDGEARIAEFPTALGELVTGPDTALNGAAPPARIREGDRNTKLTSLAGRMRRAGMELEALDEALLQANLERCEPPLERAEVRKIARSISRYPSGAGTSGASSNGNERRGGQAERLVTLLHEAELFCSTDGEAYATFRNKGHLETWPLKSPGFRVWIMARYFVSGHGAPNAQAVQSALGILEGQARASGVIHPVWMRIAEAKGALYLDLGNDRWEAVAISPEGWKITADPPVKFRRAPGLLALPTPEPGGELDALRQILLASDDDWRLMATWLLAALRPTGPYPILILHGEQGSAKSTTARMLRALVDPAAAALRAESQDTRDLMIAATNGWVVAFDNLSHVSPRLSDALCQLSTGGGFATRALYTDDAEKIFAAQRPIILNGIDEVATSGDLLDRAIIVYLPQIPESRRRTSAELAKEFENLRPRILGAALDAVVLGLRCLPEVRRSGLPRMADFAQWGCAIAPALGWSEEAFLEAYASNRDSASVVALEASPVAQVLLDPAGPVPPIWEGTASALLELLNASAKESTRKARDWPKNALTLSKAVRRLAPNLRAAGLEVTFTRQSKQRLIAIEKVGTAASSASPASPSEQCDRGPDGWELMEP